MNEDIRLSTTFFSHRKTKKLQRLLGEHGVMCLVRLWTRVALEKHSGILLGWGEDDIEIEADFSGEPGRFVDALVEVGFLDKGDEYSLHNWEDRQEWVVNTQERSDKARLLRMAKTHRKIYKKLVNDGCTGVTRKQYNKLTKIKRPVNDPLNATLTPAPAPAPDPDPVPAPIETTLARSSKKQSSERQVKEAPVLSFPLIKRDGEFHVFKSDLRAWQETFPGVDILIELKRCRQWNVDNPQKRKTKRGIRNHISAWLGKRQDRARGQPGQTKTARQNNIDQISEVRKAVEHATGFNPYKKTSAGNGCRDVDQNLIALPE